MAIEPSTIETNYIPLGLETDTSTEEMTIGSTPATNLSTVSMSGNIQGVVATGMIKSSNYQAGLSGWKIDADGSVEFEDGDFRGTITAATGTIGGWTIDTTSIYTGTEDHDGYTTNAGDLTIYSNGTDASIHAKNFYIDTSGNLTCTSATISGVITVGATSSGIASFSDAGDLVTVNESAVNALNLTNAPAAANADVTATIIGAGLITTGYITLSTAGHIKSGQTAYDTGTGFWLGDDSGTPKFSIGIQAGNKLTWDGSALTINGSAITSPTITGIATGSEIAIQGWTHDLVFSVTDADTIAWSSGTITLMNGDTYSIDAGNTGDMAAETYVYLVIATSVTVLQVTTTKATAVGSGKIMVAICENATSEAEFVVFGSSEANIDGLKIRASSITTNEIAANTIVAGNIFAGTITATQITGTSLSAIYADLGTITAGNITLDTSGYIKGGQTAYNTGTGFFLGYDTDAYKFSVGNPAANYISWDGTDLTVNGYSVVTKGRFGGDSSDGVKTVSSDETLNPTYQVYNWSSLTIDVGQTLDFGSNFQNKIIHLKVAGNCIINGTLSVKGMGGLGGAGGAAGAGDVPGGGTGSDGSDGSNVLVYFDTNDKTGKGGKKGSVTTGGAAGATMPTTAGNAIILDQKFKSIIATSGNGGAGGGGGQGASAGVPPTPGDGGAGGAGGNGGGFLILEVLGNLTRGAAGVIEIDGDDGVAGSVSPSNDEATGGGGGGGGGGAGGMGAILYSGTLSDSGSTTIAGGSAGAGGIAAESAGPDTGGGGGGGGASGGFWNSAGNAGSNGIAASGEDGGDGGAGGAGVSGKYILEANNNFG